MPQILYTQVVTAITLTRHIHVLFTETDLKPDNVLIDEGNATQTIQEPLAQSHQIVNGEFELKDYPIMRW